VWLLLPIVLVPSFGQDPPQSTWPLANHLLTIEVYSHFALGTAAIILAPWSGRTRTFVALVTGATWLFNLVLVCYASLSFGGAPL
jgi:hypothetical protein